MEVHCLGTGGYHPNAVRQTACFLLPEFGIAFDAGTAAFRLQEYTVHPDLHLFITHPHWDHIIGLTYLYVPMLLEHWESVTLYANAHTFEAIKTHLFAESTFSHMPDFKLVCIDNIETKQIQIRDATVSWQPLPSHPGGSTAYRVEHNGTRFSYLTDTFVDGSYEEFIRGSDLLIHECYFSDELSEWAEKTGHSYLSQVADLAQRTNVSRLLLTHVDPREQQLEPWDLTGARKLIAEIEFATDLSVHTC